MVKTVKKKVQNSSKTFKMDHLQMVQNSQMVQKSKMILDSPKKLRNWPKWSQMVDKMSTWLKMVQNYLK